MIRVQSLVVSVSVLLLGLAAPSDQQRRFTGHPPEPPPSAASASGIPAGLPCHIVGDSLDCSAAPLEAIGDWNVSGFSEVILDGDESSSSPASALPALPAMPGVLRLSIRHRGLSDIASGAFVKLPDVSLLDLSRNKLTADAVRADVLRGPWRKESYEPLFIETLDLSHNALHSLPRRALEHLRALKTLRLDGNPFRVLDHNTQAAIASAAKLQTLSLSGCGLVVLPAELGPRGLVALDVSHNALTAVPRDLPAGASLRRLVLDGNPVRSLPPEDSLMSPFARLTGLEQLSLSYMPALEAVGAGAFFGLASLRVLSLSHNPYLREIHPAAFSFLGSGRTLTEVSLRNNSLRWLPPKLLAWRGLTFLDLAANPWHCSCNFTLWADSALRGVNVNTRDDVRCATPAELSGAPLWNATEPSCSPALREAVVAGPPGLFAHVVLLVGATTTLLAVVFLLGRRCGCGRVGRPRLQGRAARVPWSADDDKAPLYVPAATEDLGPAVPYVAPVITVDLADTRRGDL